MSGGVDIGHYNALGGADVGGIDGLAESVSGWGHEWGMEGPRDLQASSTLGAALFASSPAAATASGAPAMTTWPGAL
ncbi:MAG: hypothetical protein Ct9H300mP12_05130 [Acidimicrobiales bacterium]|nr:MAG: hypothetical protein Ct9H300mP12_05130 [Acidimicrobiales bacterium]